MSAEHNSTHSGVACVDADVGVIVGYPPSRPVARRLVIGDGARMRSGTVVYGGSRFGRNLQTGHNVVIREECDFGDDVSVWSNTIVDYGCIVGNRVKIHANCYVSQFTVIADDAFLAPGVTLANDLFPGDPSSAAAMRGPTIESGAQIGVNATILPYVTIGAGAMIGAGAVVTRDVPPRTLAYGSPARVVADVIAADEIARRVHDRADVNPTRRATRHPQGARFGPERAG